MTVTININGLSLIHTTSGGVSRASLPDVCSTPPHAAPVPYPNTAYSRDLRDGTTHATADGGSRIAVAGSCFATSVGDEPGALGGVVSGTTAGPATWLTYSQNVKFEGRGACRLTDKMLHNGGNTINCGGALNPKLPRAARSARQRPAVWLTVRLLRSFARHNPRPAPVSRPIERITVRVHVEDGRGRVRGAQAKPTDATGVCRFRVETDGKYTVSIIHPCFEVKLRTVDIHARSKRLKLVLRHPPKLRDVAGTLVLGANGRITPGDLRTLFTRTVELTATTTNGIWTTNQGDRASKGVYVGAGDSGLAIAPAHNLKVQVVPTVWASTKHTPKWAVDDLRIDDPISDVINGQGAHRERALITDDPIPPDLLADPPATVQQWAHMPALLAHMIPTILFYKYRHTNLDRLYEVANEIANFRFQGTDVVRDDGIDAFRRKRMKDAIDDHADAKGAFAWYVQRDIDELVPAGLPPWLAMEVWQKFDGHRLWRHFGFVHDSVRHTPVESERLQELVGPTKVLFENVWTLFRRAHEADSDAILMLNDYDNEGKLESTKIDALCAPAPDWRPRRRPRPSYGIVDDPPLDDALLAPVPDLEASRLRAELLPAAQAFMTRKQASLVAFDRAMTQALAYTKPDRPTSRCITAWPGPPPRSTASPWSARSNRSTRR